VVLFIARLGMLFMPDISMIQYNDGFQFCLHVFPPPVEMLGSEKLLPNNLPDYYNIFTDESLSVKAVDDPMDLNIEEILESFSVALLIPR